jgi:AraC-like DNA-binding protein
MHFDFSVASDPAPGVPVALRTVYRLHADPSYDVKKRGVPHKDIVALRTIGGLGKVSIEGCGEITAGPETLLFFEHDKVRRYYCADETWDFWWFEFSAGGMPGVSLNRLIRIAAPEGEREDCAACMELLKKATPGTDRLASSAFSLLLSKWMCRIDAAGKVNPHHGVVEQAVDLMRRNMDRLVSINELAIMSGLCERRFRQVFEEATGMCPKKYHDALRASLAEELLLNTPLPIGEISARLGYSSQFHFCKAFKSCRGVPPSQFRKSGAQAR